MKTPIFNMTYRFALTAFAVGLAVGCSPVKFAENPAQKCNGFGEVCVQTKDPSIYEYNTNHVVPEGKVDILLLNDNSGSMEDIQARMGSSFPNFISMLNTNDWQLAMTTVDVGSPYNPSNPYNQPSLQNGNLIAFGGTTKVLSRSNTNSVSLFQSSVAITTTGYGDERGIYNANLAIQRNEGGWLRSDAHLAVIVLSDEDERGDVRKVHPGYFELEALDQPQSFINQVKSSFGPSKTFSFHSIIVKPGDSSCLITRTNGGSYGETYAQLSTATGGFIGNICASNYTSQLQDLGRVINQYSRSIQLACVPEASKPVDVKFNGTPAPAGSWSLNGSVITFTPPVASGTQVTAHYFCRQ